MGDGFEVLAGLGFGPGGGAFIEWFETKGVVGSGVTDDAAGVSGAFFEKDRFDCCFVGLVVEGLGVGE